MKKVKILFYCLFFNSPFLFALFIFSFNCSSTTINPGRNQKRVVYSVAIQLQRIHEVAYKAAQDYLQRFANDTDDKTQFIKKWVVAYEKVTGKTIKSDGSTETDLSITSGVRFNLITGMYDASLRVREISLAISPDIKMFVDVYSFKEWLSIRSIATIEALGIFFMLRKNINFLAAVFQPNSNIIVVNEGRSNSEERNLIFFDVLSGQKLKELIMFFTTRN